jgi:hypothetical protein
MNGLEEAHTWIKFIIVDIIRFVEEDTFVMINIYDMNTAPILITKKQSLNNDNDNNNNNNNATGRRIKETTPVYKGGSRLLEKKEK